MTAADSELRRCRAALLEAGDMLNEADRENQALRTAIRNHQRDRIANGDIHGVDLNLWRVLNQDHTR